MTIEKKTVYADVNASSPIKPLVLKGVLRHLETSYGNPSNLHSLGQKSKNVLESSRKSIAHCLGAKSPKDIIFTSGGTEANVLGVLGLARCLGSKIQKVIVSEIEHSSLLGLKGLVEEIGLVFDTIAVTSDGVVDQADLQEKISDGPALVSVMYANNETGVVQPVEELCEWLHKAGHFLHCDAVQAFGKLKIDLNEFAVDSLSISGHKVGALKGVGALYVRDGLAIEPLFGEGSHERSWRSGTENLTGIWSLGIACEDFSSNSALESNKLKFEAVLKEKFSAIVAGENTKRLGNTTCVLLPGTNQDLLLAGLDMNGISASAGSACKANMSTPSHVLKAMGFDKNLLKSVIRFSFAYDATTEDFDYILSVLMKLIKRS